MRISQILYHFSLRWMWWGIALASLFSSKIKKLHRGATSSHRVLKAWKPRPQSKILWMHCASLGEFEQAKPVLEWIKAEMKQVSIVLTFFSPSGYEIKKMNLWQIWFCTCRLTFHILPKNGYKCCNPTMSSL